MRMLRLLLALLSIAMLISAVPVSAVEKAKTVDELAKMYDVSSCKQCHPQIYDEWEKSIHSHSLIGTGSTAGAMKGFVGALKSTFAKSGVKETKDVKVEHFMECFKCHLPQIKDASDEVAQQIAKALEDGDKATLAKVNINCLVCHNVKAIVHKWQDGEPEKGVIYGTKDGTHADKMYATLKKSVILKEAVMCGQCHGLGPNFEFPQPSQCATLYGSYTHAYVPSGGTETCQECHMKDSGKGHTMPAYRDPDMLKMAINVEVTTLGYKAYPENLTPLAVVTVKTSNKAGHRIPDG